MVHILIGQEKELRKWTRREIKKSGHMLQHMAVNLGNGYQIRFVEALEKRTDRDSSESGQTMTTKDEPLTIAFSAWSDFRNFVHDAAMKRTEEERETLYTAVHGREQYEIIERVSNERVARGWARWVIEDEIKALVQVKEIVERAINNGRIMLDMDVEPIGMFQPCTPGTGDPGKNGGTNRPDGTILHRTGDEGREP